MEMGTEVGTETRAVAEMGTGTRMGSGTGTGRGPNWGGRRRGEEAQETTQAL